MQNWYERTRAKTEKIFQEITTHNFVTELMQATLDKDTFGFYVNQDSLYLSEYKKALVAVGSKCRKPADTQFFYEAAEIEYEREQPDHAPSSAAEHRVSTKKAEPHLSAA